MEKIDIKAVRINSPAEVRQASQALRNMSESLFDCRVAVMHNIAVRQAMRDDKGEVLATSIFGWTDSNEDRWWRSARLALDSPILTACRFESEPFWCNSEGFYTSHHNPLLEKINVAKFEQRCLINAAIVVPVHMPFGIIGAATFSRRDCHPDLSSEFAAFGDLLGLYIRTYVNSYRRVMVAQERLPVGAKLSKREVECLRWVAVGKTDEEISLILERSHATVRFHMQNAAAKLQACTRSQTVFKAAQLGYIGLHG